MLRTIVQLELCIHKSKERILIKYPYTTSINNSVKELAGVRYSKTYNSWHIPVEKGIVQKLIDSIKEVAAVDTSLLREQLLVRKQLPAFAKKPIKNPLPYFITQDNTRALELFVQALILKAYSSSTIKTYKSEFMAFLMVLGKTKAEDMEIQRLKDYMEYCHTTLNLKENTLHSRINALKFYFEQVLHKEKFFWEVPRPKKPLILPKVMNEAELGKLFNAVQLFGE